MAELIDKGVLINQLRNENIPFNADINSIIIMQPTVTEAEIRAKAIDEFVKEIKDWQEDIHDNEYDADKFDFAFERIYEIAEQLKGE